MGKGRIGAATALAALFLAVPALAQLRPPQKPPLLRPCVLEQPSIAPLFKPATAPVTPGNDDEDDDDEEDDEEDDNGEEEEEEEDDEFDEEAVRGYLLSDGVTCLGFGGSLYAGVQGDWVRASGRKLLPWRNRDVLSMPYSAVLRFDTLRRSEDGLALGAGFTMAYRSGADATIDRAVLRAGAFSGGLDFSRFNFWDGANFAFAARVPARQSYQFAYDVGLTEESRIGLSVETPVPVPPAIPLPTNAPGLRFPDLVARYLYEGEGASLQIAGALHEIRQQYSGPPRIGRAAMIGGNLEATLGGVAHTLSAQAAVMLGAPVYIGSQIDGLTARGLLTGGELPNGYSVVVSISSAWTERWSTNAYVSRYDLRVPSRGGGGRIEINRAAANIVWASLPTTRIGLEFAVSRSVVDLPNRVLSFDPSGLGATAQLIIERKF